MATVLVIEDDKLSLRILSKILTGANHSVLAADSVPAAWEALRGYGLVDLAILDNQLGGGWGWEFLQGVRKNPLYQNMPVLVYTGHTDRSSIRRYVELGVHSMLVKPYKAEFVLDEVKKAERGDWMASLLELPGVVQARLQIAEADYYSLLSAAASALEGNLKHIREAVAARRDNATVRNDLQEIFNQSATLGMPVLRIFAEAIARGVATRNMPAIQENLQGLAAVQAMLRRRAFAYMGIKDVAGIESADLVKRRVVATIPETPPISQFEVYCRGVAGGPWWTFGAHLKRLGGGRLVSAAELEGLYARSLEQAPLSDFVEAFRFITNAPWATAEELLRAIRGPDRFEAAFVRIARNLGGVAREDGADQDAARAVDRLGIYRSTIIVAAARIAIAAQIKSPLDLAPLIEHTLAVTLLSYEIGCMLRLKEEQQAAAAGLAHDAGKWVFAISEPALYAAALAWSLSTGQPGRDGEREIFGVTHDEAGRKFLEQAGVPVLLQDTAAHHAELDVVSAESAPVIACVFLANHLAWASAAENELHAKALHDALLDPQSPAWVALAEAGAKLPMDIPEMVEAMIRVAKTTAWISRFLNEWAGGVRGVSGEEE